MFYLRFLFFMALPEEFGQWSILTAALSHCCHCGTWFHLMFAFVQLCSIRGLAGAFCMPHSLCGATDVTFLLLECKFILFLKNKVDFPFSSTASNISCPWWQLLSLSVVPVAHHQPRLCTPLAFPLVVKVRSSVAASYSKRLRCCLNGNVGPYAVYCSKGSTSFRQCCLVKVASDFYNGK